MVTTSNLLGVNLSETPATNEFGFALGTQVEGTDKQEHTFVKAGSAITQYFWVGIDEDFNAYPLTKAMADDGWIIGVAQVAFASGDYGWVTTRGANVLGRLAASCALDVSLYTTGTAGVLDDTLTSQTKIDGVVAVGASTSAASNREVLLTYPRASTF